MVICRSPQRVFIFVADVCGVQRCVGGRAARRSCLTGLRRGGGGRLAGAAVLSCLVWVWRCELTTGQARSVWASFGQRTHGHGNPVKNVNTRRVVCI